MMIGLTWAERVGQFDSGHMLYQCNTESVKLVQKSVCDTDQKEY
jgi:hypothetical protein